MASYKENEKVFLRIQIAKYLDENRILLKGLKKYYNHPNKIKIPFDKVLNDFDMTAEQMVEQMNKLPPFNEYEDYDFKVICNTSNHITNASKIGAYVDSETQKVVDGAVLINVKEYFVQKITQLQLGNYYIKNKIYQKELEQLKQNTYKYRSCTSYIIREKSNLKWDKIADDLLITTTVLNTERNKQYYLINQVSKALPVLNDVFSQRILYSIIADDGHSKCYLPYDSMIQLFTKKKGSELNRGRFKKTISMCESLIKNSTVCLNSSLFEGIDSDSRDNIFPLISNVAIEYDEETKELKGLIITKNDKLINLTTTFHRSMEEYFGDTNDNDDQTTAKIENEAITNNKCNFPALFAYTKFNTSVICKLTGKYSTQIYFWLYSEYQKQCKTTTGNEIPISYKIFIGDIYQSVSEAIEKNYENTNPASTIRNICKLDEIIVDKNGNQSLDSKYKRTNDLVRNVLEPSFNEINKYTQLHIECDFKNDLIKSKTNKRQTLGFNIVLSKQEIPTYVETTTLEEEDTYTDILGGSLTLTYKDYDLLGLFNIQVVSNKLIQKFFYSALEKTFINIAIENKIINIDDFKVFLEYLKLKFGPILSRIDVDCEIGKIGNMEAYINKTVESEYAAFVEKLAKFESKGELRD